MKIYSEIDYQENVVPRSFRPACSLVLAPPRPGLVLLKEVRLARRKQYNDAKAFINKLDAWNKNGSEVLATFIALFLKNCSLITIKNLNPDDFSFSIVMEEEKILVRLGTENRIPTITINRGDVTKKYACDNSDQEGLIIDLLSVTLTKDDKKVIRSFAADFKVTMEGPGYVTEIVSNGTAVSLNNAKVIFPDEEAILKALLTEIGLCNVMEAFKTIHNFAGEELAERKITLETYNMASDSTFFEHKDSCQSLEVFRGAIIRYKAKSPSNKVVFSTRMTNDDTPSEKTDLLPGYELSELDEQFIKEQRNKWDDLANFLNSYTNNIRAARYLLSHLNLNDEE